MTKSRLATMPRSVKKATAPSAAIVTTTRISDANRIALDGAFAPFFLSSLDSLFISLFAILDHRADRESARCRPTVRRPLNDLKLLSDPLPRARSRPASRLELAPRAFQHWRVETGMERSLSESRRHYLRHSEHPVSAGAAPTSHSDSCLYLNPSLNLLASQCLRPRWAARRFRSK